MRLHVLTLPLTLKRAHHRSNLAFESQHLLHAVEKAGINNWVSLSEGQQGTLGWLTTAERKARARAIRCFSPPCHSPCGALAQQQMCLLLREALAVGKIAISKQFFSNELALTEAKMRIRDELSSYCVVTEPPKTTFGKVRTLLGAHSAHSTRARNSHA